MRIVLVNIWCVFLTNFMLFSQDIEDPYARFKLTGFKVEVGFGYGLDPEKFNDLKDNDLRIFRLNHVNLTASHLITRYKNIYFEAGIGITGRRTYLDIPINNANSIIDISSSYWVMKNRIYLLLSEDLTKRNSIFTEINIGISKNEKNLDEKLRGLRQESGFFTEIGLGILNGGYTKNRRGNINGTSASSLGLSFSMYSFSGSYNEPSVEFGELSNVQMNVVSYSLSLKFAYCFGFTKKCRTFN